MDPREREAVARATKNIQKEYQTLMENETTKKIFSLRLEEQEAQKRLTLIKPILEAETPDSKEESASILGSQAT